MNDNILSLNLEIAGYIYELHELQQVIKSLSQDPNMDKIYFEEISDRYLRLCNKLRIILESYFVEERLAGLPADFSYRKLYKQLKA